MIELSAVSYGFGSGRVRDADFRVEPGEFCAIVGPIGAGQEAVLRLIAGELVPSAGSLRCDAEPKLVTLGSDGIPRFERSPRSGDAGLVLIDATERPAGAVRDAALFLALHRLAGRGVTVVAALRHLGPAIHLADRVVLMRDGEVVSDGSPHVVLVPKFLESIYAERSQPRRRTTRARFRLHPARH